MIIIENSNPKFEVVAAFSLRDGINKTYEFMDGDYLSIGQTMDAIIIGDGSNVLAVKTKQDIINLVKNLMQFSPEIQNDGDGDYIANKLYKNDINGRVSDVIIKSNQKVTDVYNFTIINKDK